MPVLPSGALLLPLAAPGDWLEALLPILFVLFWVVSQVINVVKAVRGPARRPPQAPPVVRQAPPPRRPPVDDARADLERQIEAFRRGQAEAARPVAGAPAAAQPRLPQSRPPAPARPRAAAPAPKPPRPVDGQRPASRPAGLARSEALGGHAGEIARHVEGAFAHDLSHSPPGVHPDLGTGPRPAAPATAGPAGAGSTAADLVAMIRDPSTLRRVILLREILDRPVDRW